MHKCEMFFNIKIAVLHFQNTGVTAHIIVEHGTILVVIRQEPVCLPHLLTK